MSNAEKEYFLALGEALNLDVKPDEDGNCLLAVDNQLPVIVRANESAERMELTASVADALPEGLASLVLKYHVSYLGLFLSFQLCSTPDLSFLVEVPLYFFFINCV